MDSFLAGILLGVLVASYRDKIDPVPGALVGQVSVTPDVLAYLLFGACLFLSAVLAVLSKED